MVLERRPADAIGGIGYVNVLGQHGGALVTEAIMHLPNLHVATVGPPIGGAVVGIEGEHLPGESLPLIGLHAQIVGQQEKRKWIG
jgi:hypothetical protein